MFLPFTIRNSNYLSFLRVLNRCNNSIYTCFPKYSYSTIKINYLYHRITDSLLIEPADTYGSPISTNRSPIISTDTIWSPMNTQCCTCNLLTRSACSLFYRSSQPEQPISDKGNEATFETLHCMILLNQHTPILYSC